MQNRSRTSEAESKPESKVRDSTERSKKQKASRAYVMSTKVAMLDLAEMAAPSSGIGMSNT
jgi:hypothetical protein